MNRLMNNILCGTILVVGLILIAGQVPSALAADDRVPDAQEAPDVKVVPDSGEVPEPTEPVSPDEDSDSALIELHITPDGTYGVTVDGREVEFDYSTDQFERSPANRTTVTVFGKGGGDRDIVNPDELNLQINEDLIKQTEELRRELEEKQKEYALKKIKGLKLGTITIEEDETVKGPIVAVGKVIVRGKVLGDVVSYTRITVTSTGIITGNASAPDIVKMRGGIIEGERSEIDVPGIPDIEDILAEQSSTVPLLVNVIIFAILLLFGMILIALFGRPLERVKVCLNLSFVKSFFVGLLFWFSIGPLIALLALTIIGIPIAIIAMPLIVVFGSIMGIVALSRFAGERMFGESSFAGQSKYGQFIAGLVVIEALWLFWSLFMLSDSGFSQGMATLFLVLSIIVWSIATTSGIGAVLLTRFGTRDCNRVSSTRGRPESAPPPPTPPPIKGDEVE